MLWLIISWLFVVVSDFVIVIDCNFLHLCFVGSSAFLFTGCILVFAGVWPDSLALCLCHVVSLLCVFVLGCFSVFVFVLCCILALCLCLALALRLHLFFVIIFVFIGALCLCFDLA